MVTLDPNSSTWQIFLILTLVLIAVKVLVAGYIIMKIMKKKKDAYRVVTFLNREELDFLDEVAKDLYFSDGINIPRQKLIEAIIDAFKDQGIKDKKGIEEELAKKFKKQKRGGK